MVRQLTILVALVTAIGCGGSGNQQGDATARTSPPPAAQPAASDKGIGPIKEAKLGPIDPAVAAQGKEIFDSKCAVCHKFEERYVGPALAGVTHRRKPEWIMNMILNPDEMIKSDPQAKALFAEYLTPMAFQNVTEEDAEALLTYIRSVDSGAGE